MTDHESGQAPLAPPVVPAPTPVVPPEPREFEHLGPDGGPIPSCAVDDVVIDRDEES